jgi:hypothetical protein
MPHLRRSARGALAVLIALAALPATASAAALTATTSPVDTTTVTDTYALIGGVVNPGGTAAGYQFEWGTTAAYGQTTPLTSAANGTADVPVDYSLDGLTPRTTYHYRLVASSTSNPANRVVGADQTFTTTKALALSIVGGRIKLGKDHKAGFGLKVVGPPDTTADGLVTLKALIGKKVQTFAIKSYSIDTGTTKQLSVRVPAAVRKVLAAKKHPKVRLLVSAKTKGIKAPVIKNLKVIG